MMIRRQLRLNRHSYLTGLLASILLCSSLGCQWYGMCAPGGGAYCGSPIADAGCASCDGSCGTSCQQFPATCGTCLPGGCGGFSGMMLPLLSSHGACGSDCGCGDTYWGEWIFNPPDCSGACGEDCWAGGGGCDDGYCGYGPGCGQGLLAGPVAIIRGTYLGVTNLIQGTCATLNCGYHRSMYGYGYASECGCSECMGTVGTPACSSCGTSSCDGGCAQANRPASPVLASHPRGSGVRTARAEQAVVHHSGSNKPPHRLVTKRMRR